VGLGQDYAKILIFIIMSICQLVEEFLQFLIMNNKSCADSWHDLFLHSQDPSHEILGIITSCKKEKELRPGQAIYHLGLVYKLVFEEHQIIRNNL
jgi:hypothetical protein